MVDPAPGTPSSEDLARLRRRRRIGLALQLYTLPPLLFIVGMADLHATTAIVLGALALILGNQKALWFVPLGCPMCKRMLHRSWVWSPFARVCGHCGASVPR